ncbi:MAG: hypothetical protein R8M45_10280 [Ghiorsea sp.]
MDDSHWKNPRCERWYQLRMMIERKNKEIAVLEREMRELANR